MREEVRNPSRISHMLDAIHRVNTFMEGRAIDALEKDPMLFFAVVKNIEIVGEAAYKLTEMFKARYPEIPWRHIIAMRHILVHGYYQIEPEQLYNVYSEDLPILLPMLEKCLNNIE